MCEQESPIKREISDLANVVESHEALEIKILDNEEELQQNFV